MSLATHTAALHTAATLLRPVASFMLKCGVTWREFGAVGKTAFVAAATEEYGINGRPTNISRVALLSGLARKEVRRQRDILADPPVAASEEKTTDATRVLSGWYQDSVYQGPDGRTALLSRDEFNDLCGRYCGEVPASAMLKELIRVGAVAEVAGGKLEVRQRYYMPTNTDPQWMMTAGHYIADTAASISHNIDLAPRIPDLERGDEVIFRGQYEWNQRGGVLHWTHHDPAGRRSGGWLRHGGETYR